MIDGFNFEFDLILLNNVVFMLLTKSFSSVLHSQFNVTLDFQSSCHKGRTKQPEKVSCINSVPILLCLERHTWGSF